MMHHEDIKAAIRKQGVTPSDIARHLGVTPGMVSRVIRGTARSELVARSISRTTKISLEQLWPDVYGPAGRKPTVVDVMRGRKTAGAR